MAVSNQQTPQEWLWFLDQIGVVRSVLEIGSYDGSSLRAYATSDCLTPDAIVRAIDLGDHGTGQKLQETCQEITAPGLLDEWLDVRCLLADSHEPASQAWARQWAPYDLVFIDGDHSYEGVKADWQKYSIMGKIVALHDVGGHQSGCVKFWNELKATWTPRMLEYTAHPRYQIVGLGQQGIGIVFRERPMPAEEWVTGEEKN